MKYRLYVINAAVALVVFIITVVIGFVLWQRHDRHIAAGIEAYVRYIYKVERQVIDNVPIYDDYQNKKVEKQLRTFLFPSHMDVVKKNNLLLIANDTMLEKHIVDKKLVELDRDDALYYFYGVPKKYRYASQATAQGLTVVAERFQKHLFNNNTSEATFHVKLAVSSVLRPVEYQQSLRRRNGNAVIESTHSYGASFDIFFDDFYVVLPTIPSEDEVQEIKEVLRRKYGFLLGDSLRRQFKTLLAKTLLELQEEGILYVILERQQRCFHITIR